ncbi:MAG: cation diffusion facilitator family transporter [Gemmatimonadota bacterium]|nr:cation diffusion facilitator family transporter [Gemmatimonadota bacterium]
MLALSAAYMVAELVGGLLSNSIALLADAGHMLSDVGALALALFALWIARRPANSRRTYGYARTEILAALVNGATLVGISLYIFVEAFERLREPPPVQGAVVMGVAAGGLLINLIALWLLNANKSENLNVRGAWLHVLTDAMGSVGAILGGLAVWQFGWAWADPAISILIGLLVIYSSWSLLRDSVSVLMEEAPRDVDVDAVRDALTRTPGVTSVHDLHVWTIASGMYSLSAHVTLSESDANEVTLRRLERTLHEQFSIRHTTLQLERDSCDQTSLHP